MDILRVGLIQLKAVTGPAHWELLFRCRALDNQVFALGAAPARNQRAAYVAYGATCPACTWGKSSRRRRRPSSKNGQPPCWGRTGLI